MHKVDSNDFELGYFIFFLKSNLNMKWNNGVGNDFPGIQIERQKIETKFEIKVSYRS